MKIQKRKSERSLFCSATECLILLRNETNNLVQRNKEGDETYWAYPSGPVLNLLSLLLREKNWVIATCTYQMLFTLFSLICFFLLPLSDPKGIQLLQLRFSCLCLWTYYHLCSCLPLSITVVSFMTFSLIFIYLIGYLLLNFNV